MLRKQSESDLESGSAKQKRDVTQGKAKPRFVGYCKVFETATAFAFSLSSTNPPGLRLLHLLRPALKAPPPCPLCGPRERHQRTPPTRAARKDVSPAKKPFCASSGDTKWILRNGKAGRRTLEKRLQPALRYPLGPVLDEADWRSTGTRC